MIKFCKLLVIFLAQCWLKNGAFKPVLPHSEWHTCYQRDAQLSGCTKPSVIRSYTESVIKAKQSKDNYQDQTLQRNCVVNIGDEIKNKREKHKDSKNVRQKRLKDKLKAEIMGEVKATIRASISQI